MIVVRTDYPLTNKDLLESSEFSGGDSFFLSIRREHDQDGTWHAYIDPDLLCIIKNEQFRQQVQQEVGEDSWPTRAEIKSGEHDLGENIRTLGVGAFLWIKDSEQEERLVLLQKDKDAPGAPLCWMQASGLASDNPFTGLFREFSEETAVLSVNEEGKTLSLHSFTLPSDVDMITSSEQADIINQVQANIEGLESIENSIQQQYPQYADYELLFTTQPEKTNLKENYVQDNIVFHLPDGSSMKAKGSICDEEDNKSLNFHIVVGADMSNYGKVINADRELFGRTPMLATLEEVQRLERVTNPLGVYSDGLQKPSKVLAIKDDNSEEFQSYGELTNEQY